MKGSEEKFKQWVKNLVNDKLQELSNNLFMPSSPLFTPSSPLELRFQALVEQIDKCKTNTLEVQKLVTAKNSEIEEMQKQLKLEIQTNQKQISESFKFGTQDVNTKVAHLSSSHSSLLPPSHVQAQMRDMEERMQQIKRQTQETIQAQRTNMEQKIQHQIEAQHGQNQKIQHQIAQPNASISQMRGEIAAVQLKGDCFSSGLMGAPPSVGASSTPQPPLLEVTPSIKGQSGNHPQTNTSATHQPSKGQCLPLLIACACLGIGGLGNRDQLRIPKVGCPGRRN